ncbi:MAG: excinuclease ABC subunit UvrC, partial [Oscillospiraceae bacterium]|nr:excinuclease ABC subunit UvrC [Oscillospiraceae bacterium]
ARLVSLASVNAREECERATDSEERISKVLELLAGTLGLEGPPERIEAYDISNTGSDEMVGAMTVFVRSRPLKRDWRQFKIKTLDQPDDYHSMREVLERRIAHTLAEDGKFPPFPQLMLMDGGQAHAAMARETLAEHGLSIPVFGMVKDDRHRTRALVSPDGDEIGIVANQALFSLIGRIQEETHKSAISFHRKRRDAVGSSLDKIPGIGETRRIALLKHFGSIKAIRAASLEELGAVVPKNAAAAVYGYFRGGEEKGK